MALRPDCHSVLLPQTYCALLGRSKGDSPEQGYPFACGCINVVFTLLDLMLLLPGLCLSVCLCARTCVSTCVICVWLLLVCVLFAFMLRSP